MPNPKDEAIAAMFKNRSEVLKMEAEQNVGQLKAERDALVEALEWSTEWIDGALEKILEYSPNAPQSQVQQTRQGLDRNRALLSRIRENKQ